MNLLSHLIITSATNLMNVLSRREPDLERHASHAVLGLRVQSVSLSFLSNGRG